MSEVRLTIDRRDLSVPGLPGEVLLDITETDETILDRAVAWAQVRGYDRLTPSLESLFKKDHRDGWCAVINRPHSLVILATWPWCPGPHDFMILWNMGHGQPPG